MRGGLTAEEFGGSSSVSGDNNPMLQKLGDHIAACRDRANTCMAASTTETDERVRTQLLELAKQWEHVASTYEFIASLERFLIDQQNNALPTELGKLPKDAPA
jgi:hypothetical protein